jgi:EmrB/QacA subfamily drug resistance transporter
MAGLLLSMLLAALDQTIIGTAEPRIIAQLSGFNRYPWVATAYLLTSTLAVPIMAKLSDLYGRKPLFMIVSSVFVLASALCGAAGAVPLPLDGMNQLILFRAIQGIGAGGIMGLIFTIVADIFSPQERGRYQGFFSAVWGLSAIFGPTLGGWLTDQVSWRACFYVNVPVGVAAILALHMQFPSLKPRALTRTVDWAGFLTLSACVVPLLLALTWVTEYGWTAARVDLLLAMSVAMLVAFIVAERRAVEPLIPLSLFANPIIRTCAICVFLLGIGMFGVIIYLPLYMQGVMAVSATESGTLMMPMMMGTVFGTAICGQALSRLGEYKKLAVLGSVLVTLGMFDFAQMTAATPRLLVVAGMIVTGLGMGCLMPVYTVAVQNVAPPAQMGAATAATIFFRSIGATVGVAAFGSLMLTTYHRDFARVPTTGIPPETLSLFSNPVLLMQMRPELETTFSRMPGGAAVLQTLFEGVRTSLGTGLHHIFVTSAVLMTVGIGLHASLKSVRLRSRHVPEPELTH